ncbi:mannan endo-1,6-alpha-mannosidase, partial [Trichodelitschia bisporula]
LFLAAVCCHVSAIELDLTSTDSIKKASSTITRGLLKYYHGNEPGQIPGALPKPYYWWQAGAMWGELIEYWSYTGDTTYNDIVTQALLFQMGQDRNYMPANWSNEEGNDDQSFWAFSVLTAAELKFPDPPDDKPSWLALAQAVFNTQVPRWDTQTCGGGLRWQILFTNPGWTYKNTISNGALFQLSARLARYTGNATYALWADKVWDWLASTPNLTPEFQVNDGSDVAKNCTDANHNQWTYNYGTMLMGAANMYNYTDGNPLWKKRVQGLLDVSLKNFFPLVNPQGQTLPHNAMVEISCEWARSCNPDQTSFKAYLARWMAATTQLAPFTFNPIMLKLQSSARGAAMQCSGGDDKVTCGRDWNTAIWDGFSGVGEQMSALAVIQSILITKAPRPVTSTSGGTSKGDPNAGGQAKGPRVDKVTKASKVAAGFLTTFLMVATLGLAAFMI